MIKAIKKTDLFLLIIAFIITLLIFISGFFFDKYLVVSGSMEPNIPTGSVAIVNRNTAFDDVQIGDVVIFKYKDRNIIHRVIETTTINGKKYFKTKGDANSRDDGFVTTEENYCGKALFHIE